MDITFRCWEVARCENHAAYFKDKLAMLRCTHLHDGAPHVVVVVILASQVRPRFGLAYIYAMHPHHSRFSDYLGELDKPANSRLCVKQEAK